MSNASYHQLRTDDEHSSEEDDAPPLATQSIRDTITGNRWNHIEDLDDFFTRVYQYHQQNGFFAIVLSDVLELLQFMFVVSFAIFLVVCLKYDVLFDNDVEIDSVEDLIDTSQFWNVSAVVIIVLLVAIVFWVHQLSRTIWRAYKFWEIRSFYSECLGVPPSELRNYTWKDILVRLNMAQKKHKMNIRKHNLTELDVHYRILRRTNFLVAMVNKEKLPCKLNIPFLGEKIFFSTGLRYNFEMILFWGPYAPFDNSYHLNDKFKQRYNRDELTNSFQGLISVYALVNLILFPVIFLYNIFHFIFHFAELIKRQPGALGARRWTTYSHYYLRHFNELDHELEMRLNQAYLPASKYMDIFVSPIVVVLARNIAFVAGSLLAVLAVLTVLQEQLLTADNVLVWMSLLGIVLLVCSACLPDENRPLCPQDMMLQILTHIQYMPDEWKEQPHSDKVRNQFSQLFQFKVVTLIDELLSPILTPFVLYFKLRPMAADVVSFLHDFTIDVSGVGDVCSFAEMNPKRHGSPGWLSTSANNTQYQQTELGKTELSLVQFQARHPTWQPSEEAAAYISNLKTSLEASTNFNEEESLNYLSIHPGSYSYLQQPITDQDSMQWSIWSIHAKHPQQQQPSSMDSSMLDTLQLHKLHDQCINKGELSSIQVPTSSMYTSGPPALVPGGGAQEPLLISHTASDTVLNIQDHTASS